MSPDTYKILHLAAVLLLFFSLGGVTLQAMARGAPAGDDPPPEPGTKPPGWGAAMAFHGVAVLVILVSGFGYLAKAKLAMGGWVHAKLLIWMLIAGCPFLLKRKPEGGKALWFVLPLLGALAAFLAVTKPGA